MTIKRLMDMVQELTRTPVSDAVLLNWLSNCENTILTDIFLAAPESCTEYTAITENNLLVPHPFDKLYLPYMQAQIYHAAGEFMQYDAYMQLYNEYRDEYARYVLSTVNPATGEAVSSEYYLTAYAIAVAHGYSGSEEEWIRSLKGSNGKSAYDLAVEGGYEGTLEQFESETANLASAVKFTAQSLTDEQKARARENIGAAEMEAVEAAAEAAHTADHASEAAARAMEAAQAAAEAVDEIPDWAKQPEKPDYQANEIDYNTTFIGEQVGTVDEALAVMERKINDNGKVNTVEHNEPDEDNNVNLESVATRTRFARGAVFTAEGDSFDSSIELVGPKRLGKRTVAVTVASDGGLFLETPDDEESEDNPDMRVRLINIREPRYEYDAANKRYVDSKRSTISIRLISDMWQKIDEEVYEQTVNVTELEDIDEDEDVLLQCCPAPQSIHACNTYGVQCTEATEGTMTFRATTHPAENENIGVVVAMWR